MLKGAQKALDVANVKHCQAEKEAKDAAAKAAKEKWPNKGVFEVMAEIKIEDFNLDELEGFLKKTK